jgi:protease-4
MKNFLIGLISGFLLAGLVAVIVVFVFVRIAASFSDRTPTVADGSTLILKMEGSIPEKAPTEVPLPFLEDQAPLTLPQTWALFRKAASDPKIKAIVFEPQGLAVGWAELEEIHGEMLQFKKSGKPLVAFLRHPGSREFYLSTACDKIYMTPEDTLDVKGMRVEAMYLKDTLGKFGVKMDVIHAGKYKDAFDMFSKNEMSPETKEVLDDILNQYFGDLIDTMAAGRKKQPAEIKALIDQGPFEASQALSDGLIDGLAFEDQVSEALRKQLNQSELKMVSHKTYIKAGLGDTGGKRIALIVGEGEILSGSGDSSFGSDTGIVSGPFIKVLKQVENDTTIKAVILRVNSPGGEGVASDDILHEAQNLSRKKPMVISMGDLAASGGYFISMTGDPIVAYPNTLTGSIGVIMGRINLRGLYDKLNIHVEMLQRGHYADLDSEYQELTPDDRAKLESEIEDFYKGFVERVAKGRKRSFGQIDELGQGRVWLGTQAKQNGLVDELGGLDLAIEMVKKKAGIPVSDKISLVTFPPKRNLFDLMFSRQDDTAAIDAKVQKVLGFPISVWRKGGFLKMMPYTISVK